MYAEGAVGVIKAMVNTAADMPVSPVRYIKVAVAIGFNPNWAIEEVMIGLT